jgi:hypothetical protein
MDPEDFVGDELFARARLADVEGFLEESIKHDLAIEKISWQAQKEFWLEVLRRIEERKKGNE